MKLLLSVVIIGGALLLAGSDPALADPHSDGLTFGKGQLDKLNGNVTSQNAKDAPFYTDKPPQAGSFGGSSLFDVGVGRINTCKTAVHGPDGVANQECDAVNFLAKNPQNRIKVDVKPNDPILKGIEDTINNAKPGGINDNGCIQKTTTTPDQHSTEVCNEYNVRNDQICTMGQVVQVDAQSNYLCNKNFSQYEPRSCAIDTTCNVTSSQLTCSPATFLCKPGADACCSFVISCNGDGSANVNYNDCCGKNYQTTAVPMGDFANGGVQYNLQPDSKIYCNNSGSCYIDFSDYLCADPNTSNGFFPNTNQFNLSAKVVFACFDTNNCSELESLTW
ncbi:hypothetical protein [Cupriavidus sp. TMH.W2]|uniref:hypothetical protein n=1 Tax=Cupriavidus sp. TMH.W2 TaxID=3434465 RepID=UPI003D76D83A